MSPVVALLAAAPSPSPSDVELTAPGGGSPGFIGFVVTFLLAVAAIGLFLSLTKQLRKVDRRARQLGLDDDGTGFAFGTPGGDQQDQWTVPFLLRHLLGGLDLQAAIDAPSWHSSHVPESFYPRTHVPRGLVAESRLGADVLAALADRGHAVQDAGPWSLGRISAAGVRADGFLVAAANPRGMQGYAVGR
ncbi:gamma-glutamyltransferase [Cellulomonas septica]|uniref:gamma-glutamyltransferase n=1 Tax=Cellulomonas septica TaxID=285080 RepID=UPI0031B5D80E